MWWVQLTSWQTNPAQDWWNSCAIGVFGAVSDFAEGFRVTADRVRNTYGPERNLPSEWFFTDQDILVVGTHLTCFCCASAPNRDDCRQYACPVGNYFAESVHLFDHLVTIGMKKLDGNAELCDRLQIDCHPLWQERRERIVEEAERPQGAPPRLLQEKFGQMRWNEDNLADSSGTMYAEYLRMCTEAWVLSEYSLLSPTPPLASSAFAAIDRRNGCIALVDRRFQQEAHYVRTLAVQKWIDFVVGNLHGYLYTYSIKNRLFGLLNKYTDFDACISTVLKMANERTIQCQ